MCVCAVCREGGGGCVCVLCVGRVCVCVCVCAVCREGGEGVFMWKVFVSIATLALPSCYSWSNKKWSGF